MLIDLTYSCSMGCSHCISDCKADQRHIPLPVFKDTLKFLEKENVMVWNFSGGEIFEHPEILSMLQILEEFLHSSNTRHAIALITNGRRLVQDKNIYNAVAELKKKLRKDHLIIQVTDDPRFYPTQLTTKEIYWLKKLDAIVEGVPSDPCNKEKCLYPQGRALVNYPDAEWNTKAPKCANCRLLGGLAGQTFTGLVKTMFANGKTCTPAIAPDGSIKIGESALCPAVASIYDSDTEIIEKIRKFNCHQCEIPWSVLKDTNPVVYAMLSK